MSVDCFVVSVETVKACEPEACLSKRTVVLAGFHREHHVFTGKLSCAGPSFWLEQAATATKVFCWRERIGSCEREAVLPRRSGAI